MCVLRMHIAAAQHSKCVSVSSAKDLTGLKLFEPCLAVLKSRMESRELEKEVCDDVIH